MDKKITQNYFLIPFIVTLVQFAYIFVALIGSGYDYVPKVFSVSVLICFIWGLLFFLQRKRNGSKGENSLIIILLSIILALFFVKLIWFGPYVSLDPIGDVLSGQIHIDTLYHSSIAESFITNGYPSIQQNAPLKLSYHCFSHLLIAGISCVTNLPCLIVYAYLYPIIFVPIFIALIFACIKQYRVTTKKEFTLLDYCSIILFFCGFFYMPLLNKIGFFWNAVYNSQSFLISIIVLLIFFRILKPIKKIKYGCIFIEVVLTPTAILLSSYSKISTGFIFTLLICYYYFRHYLSIKSTKYVYTIIYLLVFGIYYYCVQHGTPVSLSLPESSSMFNFFHFAKTYIAKPLILVHYLFIFIPCIGLLTLKDGKIFSKEILFNDNNLFIEVSWLLSLAGILPGMLLKIDGGSALYFVFAAFIFVVIICFIYDLPNGLFNKLNFWNKQKICAGVIVCLYFGVLIYSNFPLTCLRTLCISREDFNIHTQKLPKSLSFVLSKSNLTNSIYARNEQLQLLKEIRKDIGKNRKQYCVYMDKTSELYNFYNDIYTNKLNYLRVNLFVSGYLGIPVINAMYTENELFYRGDGLLLGNLDEVTGYSMPPVFISDNVDYKINDIVKELQKDYIIKIFRYDYIIEKVHK